MHIRNAIFVLLCIASGLIGSQAQYEPPEPLIEPLYPRGLRVSIPDAEGIKLFAFHGQLNKPMEGREIGVLRREIFRAIKGRWTYLDKKARLKIGDKIYYWIQIDHFDGERRVGHTQENKVFTVTWYSEIDPRQALSRLCPSSPTTLPKSQRVCSGDLIFEDTFDNHSTSMFTPEVTIGDQPDYPFVVYMKNEENLFYENDTVIIKPQLLEERFKSVREELDITETCTAPIDSELCRAVAIGAHILPPIISAKITTKNTFSFTYGRIEVIAKVPIGDWIYPEIQLEPRDNSYGVKNYASGIMRVAFSKGNLKYAKDLDAGIVMDSNKEFRGINIKYKIGINNWSRDYHNYTMIWKPDSVIVCVDGEEFGAIIPGRQELERGTRVKANRAEHHWLRGTVLAPFDKPFYIALGVAVGGNEFKDEPDKPWANDSPRARLDFWKEKSSWHSTWTEESRLQVKSVRVYAL